MRGVLIFIRFGGYSGICVGGGGAGLVASDCAASALTHRGGEWLDSVQAGADIASCSLGFWVRCCFALDGICLLGRRSSSLLAWQAERARRVCRLDHAHARLAWRGQARWRTWYEIAGRGPIHLLIIFVLWIVLFWRSEAVFLAQALAEDGTLSRSDGGALGLGLGGLFAVGLPLAYLFA